MLRLDGRTTNLQRLQNTITIHFPPISARAPTCTLLDENLRTSLYLGYSTEPTIPGLGVSHRPPGLDLVRLSIHRRLPCVRACVRACVPACLSVCSQLPPGEQVGCALSNDF